MSDPATHESPFLSLPGEMREMIYAFVFMDPYTQAGPMDSLVQRVPHSSSLRCVSRALHQDTARCYDNALKLYDGKRQGMVEGLVKYYEDNTPEMIAKVGVGKCIALLSEKTGDGKLCRHECARRKREGEMGCYMCEDPAHRECFECGRNLLIPFFCLTPTFNFPAPATIVPGTHGSRQTITGLSIASVPRSRVERLRPGSKLAMPTASFPWYWWQELAARHKAIDVRCCVRMDAIDQYYRTPQPKRSRFTEAVIRAMEKTDGKDMEFVGKVERKLCRSGKLRWEGEFERRAIAKARMHRVPVEVFKPDGFGVAEKKKA
ncbi:Hypothetical predicted protein [Lecanosticta acicola]|uniref:Uncharacterized protein n=1 Tax=Lecanosticta acicola TaxID=111012 RepID=A0AAI9E8K8_9PEZI|nr:Hypothetical predicted protein [Lecanosticta acicola]